jgi:hypothetical protein
LAWADAKPAARDAWDRVEVAGIRACDAGGCCEMSDTDIDEEEETSKYAQSVR